MRNTDEKIREAKGGLAEVMLFPVASTIASAVESPIEELMAWSLLRMALDPPDTLWGKPQHRYPGIDPSEDHLKQILVGGMWAMALQVPVIVDDSSYRIDIALAWSERRLDGSERWTYVAIECDGHDFHEKTKEQAQRDKRRDRDLQRLGWRVVRFTGSEICRDPRLAAYEAWHFVWSVAGVGLPIDNDGVEGADAEPSAAR